MEKLRSLTIFNKENKLTKQEKVEIAAILVASIVITITYFLCVGTVYAEITPAEMAEMVKKIVKIICYIAGALFALTGIIKFAIAHANEEGPAQQKAIMMIATGVVLVALGLAMDSLIKESWFQVS